MHQASNPLILKGFWVCGCWSMVRGCKVSLCLYVLETRVGVGNLQCIPLLHLNENNYVKSLVDTVKALDTIRNKCSKPKPAKPWGTRGCDCIGLSIARVRVPAIVLVTTE